MANTSTHFAYPKVRDPSQITTRSMMPIPATKPESVGDRQPLSLDTTHTRDLERRLSRRTYTPFSESYSLLYSHSPTSRFRCGCPGKKVGISTLPSLN
jgi:hypothetical protein